jgi:hypothetical protein
MYGEGYASRFFLKTGKSPEETSNVSLIRSVHYLREHVVRFSGNVSEVMERSRNRCFLTSVADKGLIVVGSVTSSCLNAM